MSRRMHLPIATCVMFLLACYPVFAQDAKALRRENARLTSELAALRSQTATPGAPTANSAVGEQRVGNLALSIASIRVGPASGYASGHMAVTPTIRIRNLGSLPVALNYNKKTFGLVDDLGYAYELYHEDSDIYYAEDVKGISMANGTSAGTDDVLLPGQSTNVTFIATRYMRDGETVGNHFDINVTFGAYENLGQGHIRHVRNYAASFIGVPRSSGSQAAAVVQDGKETVTKFLRSLIGH